MRIRLISLDIEDATNCNFDYIRFISPAADERFCGNEIEENILSFRGPLEIQFVADGSVVEQGFQLYYFIERDEEGSGDGPIPDPSQFLLILYRILVLAPYDQKNRFCFFRRSLEVTRAVYESLHRFN